VLASTTIPSPTTTSTAISPSTLPWAYPSDFPTPTFPLFGHPSSHHSFPVQENCPARGRKTVLSGAGQH
ncbi:MAG: hypothetical protein K2O61_09160, partial [Bacteroidaceae bacterium]|nr:hypothetical protein [Bacteroidaceae bacterium]